MGKIDIVPVNIGIGNDFKIRLTQVTDTNGNVLNLNEDYIGIDWMDSGGVRYTTIWNPKGVSENAKMVGGELYLIFNWSKHSFRNPGLLRYQIFTEISDYDFIDNMWNVRDEVHTSTINLVVL